MSDRIALFERDFLSLEELVADLAVARPDLDPPRESWAATFDTVLGALRERVEASRSMKMFGFDMEPGYADVGVRDMVQTLARLVRHPDER